MVDFAIKYSYQFFTHFVITSPIVTKTPTSVVKIPTRKNVCICLLFHNLTGALQHFISVNFMM